MLSVCSWVAEQLGPELLLEQYWEEEAVSEKAGERWKSEMLLILTHSVHLHCPRRHMGTGGPLGGGGFDKLSIVV